MSLSYLAKLSALVFLVSIQAFVCSFAEAADNKNIVTAFYKLAFIQHKPQEAADQYLGAQYIQHNPKVADGKKAFTDFFVPFFKMHPEHRAEIKRVIAEGDLVVLHVFSRLGLSDRGASVVDIFRVNGEKIIEHWDVRQEVPEKSANNNTMF